MPPLKLPKLHFPVLLLLLCMTAQGYPQSQKTPVPIEFIGNWSVEDSTKKEDHETMVLSITQDSVGLVYVNFLEAFYGLDCTYKAISENGIAQIKLGKCSPNGNLSSIFCYLKEPSTLAVFFANREEEKKIPERDTESWLLFTRITSDE